METSEYLMPVDVHGKLLFDRAEAIRWYRIMQRRSMVSADREDVQKYWEASQRIKREYRL